MSEIKDAVLAAWEFLSKIVGNNHWIYLFSFCVVAWIGFVLSNSFWFLLIAIFFSLIILLTMIMACYIKITKRIATVKKKKRDLEQQKQANLWQEQQHRERELKHASLIWQYVGHFKKDKIEKASYFLTCPIHDNNKFMRFVEKPDRDDYKGNELYWHLYNSIQSYRFHRKYYQELSLLNKMDIPEGFYVEIEPYFYSLLENYLKTGEWVKL